MGNWGKRDRTEQTGMFVNKAGLYQFKIANAMDSLALGSAYTGKYSNEFRQLVFSAEVVSEGEMKGKIMSWRYNLKFGNDNSLNAVMRHIENLFSVSLDGDEDTPLDMAPFIGRIFMAEPKARDIGTEDDAKFRVKLMWFDPDNPDAAFGDFIFDEKIVTSNKKATIEPGDNATSEAYWAIIEKAGKKKDEKATTPAAQTGDDDDEPLPF